MGNAIYRFIELFYWPIAITILLISLILRLAIFDQIGGDWNTYKDAVNDFTTGVNPYERTIRSFNSGSSDHGYAYFPTLLYVQSFIWVASNLTGYVVPSYILWKIPVLICDLAIAFIILFSARKNKHKLFSLVLFGFWLLNPYLLARYEYSLYDPIFLLVLLLSLYFNDKYPKLSGFLLGLAVSLKTIPLIIFPMLFLATNDKEKFKFVASFAMAFLIISLPFLKSINDINYMVQGSLLVHGERGIQGRPLLTVISYYTQPFNLNFFQSDYHRIYAIVALIASTGVPLFLYLKKNIKNLYLLATLAFLTYILLSPVLSRTHLLWFLPFLLMYITTLNRENINYKKLNILLAVTYLTMFVYLFNWGAGMRPGNNFGSRPILPKNEEPWELIRLGRHKFYEIRDTIRR